MIAFYPPDLINPAIDAALAQLVQTRPLRTAAKTAGPAGALDQNNELPSGVHWSESNGYARVLGFRVDRSVNGVEPVGAVHLSGAQLKMAVSMAGIL
jgi:hypothetical protein